MRSWLLPLLLASGCEAALPLVSECPMPSMEALYAGEGLVDPSSDVPQADACAARPHDVALVLGCPSNADGSPSDCQRARAALALRVYRAGLAPRFITSGGAVQNAHVEAEALRDLLLAGGVPAAAVVLEPRAEHTDENLYYSTRLMAERGWRSALVLSDTPGHLLYAALCDSNCCVAAGRLTVLQFPLGEQPATLGHYALYPAAAPVSAAECEVIKPTRKLLCLNLPSRRACAGRLMLPP